MSVPKSLHTKNGIKLRKEKLSCTIALELVHKQAECHFLKKHYNMAYMVCAYAVLVLPQLLAYQIGHICCGDTAIFLLHKLSKTSK